MCLQHKTFPPQPHFQSLNPQIACLNGSFHFAIPEENVKLVARGKQENPNQRLYCGVSCFGSTGSNFHAILSEHPSEEDTYGNVSQNVDFHDEDTEIYTAGSFLFSLSAKTPTALRELARKWTLLNLVSEIDGGDTTKALAGLSLASNIHSSRLTGSRLGLVAGSTDELLKLLLSFANSQTSSTSLPMKLRSEQGGVAVESSLDHCSTKKPVRVCFAFAGQGSQCLGMGEDLARVEPYFAATLAKCDRLLRPILNGQSILEV